MNKIIEQVEEVNLSEKKGTECQQIRHSNQLLINCLYLLLKDNRGNYWVDKRDGEEKAGDHKDQWM